MGFEGASGRIVASGRIFISEEYQMKLRTSRNQSMNQSSSQAYYL